MSTLKTIIKIAKGDYDVLVEQGSITKGGVVYTYDPDETLYMVDDGLSDDYVVLGGGSGVLLSKFGMKTEINDLSSRITNETTARKEKDTALSNSISSLETTVSNKVDKVSGKGLSTNDYTTAEKTKLAGIAEKAEVNQNAFSNITIGNTTIAADSKTDTLTLVAGSNVTLTPDATNDKITISSTNTDTHNTSKNVITDNANSITNNAAINGNVYLNHIETTPSGSHSVTSSQKIEGIGGTAVSSDASGNITIKNHEVSYATATTDTRGHWTVTIPGITELYDGLKINVRLSTTWYGNGEYYNTLNVNGLGPQLVWYRPSERLTSHFQQYAECTLTYWSSNCGSYTVTSTTGELVKGNTYTGGWMSEYSYYTTDTSNLQIGSSRPTAASALGTHHLCAADKSGRIVSLVSPVGSYSSSNPFTPTATAFKPENIYICTGSFSAGVTISDSYLYTSRAYCYTNYNFNSNPTTAISTIYLVGTLDKTTGLFTLDQTTTGYYLYVPCNAAISDLSTYFTSGKYYISIGQSYATSSTYFSKWQNNTVYYFDGTNLVPVIVLADRAKTADTATALNTGTVGALDQPVYFSEGQPVACTDVATKTALTNGLAGKANTSHTHTKSQITDFPTSLKNPNALTIKLNGASQGAYDGSSAKEISITADSIGAVSISDNESKPITFANADAGKTLNICGEYDTVRIGNIDDPVNDQDVATKSYVDDSIEALDATKDGTSGQGIKVQVTQTDGKVSGVTVSQTNNFVLASEKGANSGVATLGTDGKIPSSQLPSYVDDVLEYSSKSSFPTAGETGKIYVATDTNLTYRWSGSAYVEISQSLALGTTSSTAYYGDKGKTAYEHSQLTSGNPHKVTKSDVGLGNVDNTADANKSVKYATSAGSATTATKDVVGNQINTTYLPKQRVENPSISVGSTEVGITPFNVLGYKSSGYPVYTDPEFASGVNNMQVYNNTSGSTDVTITRGTPSEFGITDSGNSSGYVLRIQHTGTNTSPGYGGFYLFIAPRANAVFVQIFRAKIPVGYAVYTASNSMGSNFGDTFITDTVGTGKWEWYGRIVHCGSTGSFASGGYVFLYPSTGAAAPTSSAPINWYISYANIIDITKGNYDGLRTKYSDSATTATSADKLTTARTINGTSFNGTADITTSKWGTTRNIYISDSDGNNTGTAVSVNGSDAVTLRLPATIKATLKGNADTATTAVNAGTAELATVATTANSVAWSNVTGKPTSISATLANGYYGMGRPDDVTSKTSDWIRTTESGLIPYSSSTSGSSSLGTSGWPFKTVYAKTFNGNLTGDVTGNVTGSLSGNATTATKLQTPRTISLGTGVSSTATSFSGESNITIPVTSIKESYLAWGGTDLNATISPVDAAMSSFHSANRAQFCKAAGVTIEYSTDGGSTWTDYGLSDTGKTSLLSDIGSDVRIGKKTSATSSDPATANDKLRITLNATSMGLYTRLRKILINLSTNGAAGCTVMVEHSMKGSETTWTTDKIGAGVSGWSGWNSLSFSGPAFGGGIDQTSNWANIRMTFSITKVISGYAGSLRIINILLFGDTCWSYPSVMARTGHLYSYDASQNATFPASLTTTGFGIFKSGIYEGGTSSSNLLSNKYAAKSHTHSYAGSSSAGGAATSANKLNTDAGSTTTPVYFSGGVPVALGYSISKSVPSDAVFTDTHYSSKSVVAADANSTTNNAATNGNVKLNHVENSAVTSSHIIKGTGATTVTSDSSGTITINSTDTTYTHPSYTAAAAAARKIGRDKTGHVIIGSALTKSDIGLENVDNTADANKSVKSATTATYLGSNTVGAVNQPIYLDGGTPSQISYTINSNVPENAVFTDTKVTAVGNHYTPSKSKTTSASGGTLTDITNSSSGTNVVTGVEMDAAGHVTGVTSVALKSTNTNTTYSAGTGISLSGTTFSNSGVRSVSQGSNGYVNVNTNGSTSSVAVYSLPTATVSQLGGVVSQTTGTTANRDYKVEVESDGKMKVNVPWTDTNTTYSTGTASISGLTKLYTSTGTNTDGTMTQSAINTALSGKADSSHNHNDIYYTEAEVNTKLSSKVDNTAAGVSTALNKLTEGTSTPSDADYYISQYAGGGTTTTTYHRRPLSALWTWIQNKLALVATSGSYTDLANKPTSLKNPSVLAIGTADTNVITYDGSELKGLTIQGGGSTTVTGDATANSITISSTGVDYTAGTGISISNATISNSGVTGVKGVADSVYKTGNVNLTPANIGAASSSHTHSSASTSAAGFMSAADKTNLNNLTGFIAYDDINVAADGEVGTAVCDEIRDMVYAGIGCAVVVGYNSSAEEYSTKYPASISINSWTSDTNYILSITIYFTASCTNRLIRRDDTGAYVLGKTEYGFHNTSTLTKGGTTNMSNGGVWSAINTPTTTAISTAVTPTLTSTSPHRILHTATTSIAQQYTLPASPVANETFVFYKLFTASTLTIKSTSTNMYNIKTGSTTKVSSISYTASSSPSRCKITCIYSNSVWYIIPENLND